MFTFKYLLSIGTMLLPVSCTNVIQSWNFKRNRDYTNSNSQSALGVIRSIHSIRSTTECVRACASDYLGEKCQSVQFERSSGICELLVSQHEVSDKIKEDETGWSAYEFGKYTIAPFSQLKTSIVGGMIPGRSLTINGVFDLNAKRMFFTLKDTDGNVAIHFGVRFHYSTHIEQVVRNSRTAEGVLGTQEVEPSGQNFPFYPGKGFEINVIAETTRFKILVDGQHFTFFNYRTSAEQINSFNVVGDATLKSMVFQHTST